MQFVRPEALSLLLISAVLFAGTLVPNPALAAMPTVEQVDSYPPSKLFTVTGGTLEREGAKTGTRYRWRINPGETSIIAINPAHPLFARLRYFDRLHCEFRVVSGEVNNLNVKAVGHVSGPRQSKVHSWNLGARTTEQQVWHIREIEFVRPYWLPWDNPDGEGAQGYFRLEALGLTPNTVIELRNLRFTRDFVLVKPDYETPITWPVKKVNDDGSVSYTLTYQVMNNSGRPTDITAKVVSSHSRFTLALDKMSEPAKSMQIVTFALTATISKADIAKTPELYAEPLRISFAAAHAPEAPCLWQGQLVRPLSPSTRRQVVVAPEDLRTMADGVRADDAAMKRVIVFDKTVKAADEFVGKRLDTIPISHTHVTNSYPGNWRPGDYMPEIVETKTGEREVGTERAGLVWKEYLGLSGQVCDNLGMAYLMTGDEQYAKKAIDLFSLYARQYTWQWWRTLNDVPWNQGVNIQFSSRVASNSSYGTNWYFKGHSRLLSMIADSPSWTPETREQVFRGFVLPYATELLKLPGSISNQTDITNHNLLLLGFAFDDALLVREALLNDSGLISRMKDIEPDGFSGEGRPLNYHFAEMAEYLPSISYLENSGLDIAYAKDRLLAAFRMPYLRASLAGRVPNSGDCARGFAAGTNALADHLITIFPDEHWLYEIGASSTLAKKLRQLQAGDKTDPAAWKRLVSTEPYLFPNAGVAILRAGDTPETQVMATLDYGRSVFHGAFDRNQITLSAFGKIFTHGPGSNYNLGSGGITRATDKRLDSFCSYNSIGHNIIIVDQQNQRTAIGELMAWNPQTDFQVAVAHVNGIQPGVSHTRGLVLTRGIVVMLDRVESQKKHTYDFVYHNFGELTPGEGWRETTMTAPIAATGNYDSIIDPKRLAGAGPLHLTWDLSAQMLDSEQQRKAKANAPLAPLSLHLWQAPLTGGEVFTGVTGLNNPNTMIMPDRAPSMIHRVQGKCASFATVLEPVSAGTPRVTAVESVPGTGVTVTLVDGSTITVSLDELVKKYRIKR